MDEDRWSGNICCVCVHVHAQMLSLYSVQQCLIFFTRYKFFCVFSSLTVLIGGLQDLELGRL